MQQRRPCLQATAEVGTQRHAGCHGGAAYAAGEEANGAPGQGGLCCEAGGGSREGVSQSLTCDLHLVMAYHAAMNVQKKASYCMAR
jgi:hypothetical protein